jgi:ankyrin repeat protein
MLVQAGWEGEHAVDRKESTALHWAAGNGHWDVVAYLLPMLPVGAVNRRNKQGRTALMHAAKNGHLPVVKLLIEGHVGVEWDDRADITVRMKDGSGIFDWAVFGGNFEVMGYLKDEVEGLDVHGARCFFHSIGLARGVLDWDSHLLLTSIVPAYVWMPIMNSVATLMTSQVCWASIVPAYVWMPIVCLASALTW